jgi:flavin reductase (DIM6/NTAB) family NADH-FMN oxidoreductase RutF
MPKTWRILDESRESLAQGEGWPAFFPCGAVLVSCVAPGHRPNIIAVAGVAVCCRLPFTIGIAVCRQDLSPSTYRRRYSYELIRDSGEFVVNLPHAGLQDAVNICGSVSGRDVDKFARAGLTPAPAQRVRAPIIAECPVNFECVVRRTAELGSHDWFMGEVVVVHVDDEIAAGRARLAWGYLPRLERV